MSRSFPWNSRQVGIGADGFPVYDRSYDAQDLRDTFKSFFSNGVVAGYEEELVCSHNSLDNANNPMGVVVSAGSAHVEGTTFFNDEATTLTLSPASSHPRIDTIVVRMDASLSVRDTYLAVVEGTPSDNPVHPPLQRDGGIYEIGIADVRLEANATVVDNNLITMTVADASRCGFSGTGVYVDDIIGSVGLKAYPVGALYLAFNSTSPSALFGGSWLQITGRFLRAASDTNTGGVDNQTLTTAQMPAHNHSLNIDVPDTAGYGLTGTAGYQNRPIVKYDKWMGRVTSSTGSSNSFSNMPAYQDIYVWRRIA